MSAAKEDATDLPRPIGNGLAAVVGQEIVLQALQRAIGRDRLSHALLFAGPQGVGKATTALLLAQALNCQTAGPVDACGECVSCSKIARGIHPDVVWNAPSPRIIKSSPGSQPVDTSTPAPSIRHSDPSSVLIRVPFSDTSARVCSSSASAAINRSPMLQYRTRARPQSHRIPSRSCIDFDQLAVKCRFIAPTHGSADMMAGNLSGRVKSGRARRTNRARKTVK